ncbi:hypothetical protein [Methylobacterium oryzihabitans]|uniref:SRPBCC family protein n=1 Tax=Methylobacterium oryzihabitans TaxID=2499852 RepID=A0A437NVX0_9HYPH|nr:hypothetical protein [Methylobacterium oryzihabitans]RVU14170.1 hypothetical protein EOE48_24175 [Methylobacterium oryzihabitans]
MLTHHTDPIRTATTLTTSRCVEALPHDVERSLQCPNLFRSLAASREPRTVAIDFNPRHQGCGAITIACTETGISERRPLRTRHHSPWNLTAETEDGALVRGGSRAPVFALDILLVPLIRPRRPVATRVGMFFRFVPASWWPVHLEGALTDLADLWLRRLEEHQHSSAEHHR